MEIQQAAWGKNPNMRRDLLRSSKYGRPQKNVAWWRGAADSVRLPNYESNFS